MKIIISTSSQPYVLPPKAAIALRRYNSVIDKMNSLIVAINSLKRPNQAKGMIKSPSLLKEQKKARSLKIKSFETKLQELRKLKTRYSADITKHVNSLPRGAKKTLIAQSKAKQDSTEKEKLRKLRLKHENTYEEIRKQKRLMDELRKRKRELKERGKRVNIPPQDVLRHEQHLASLYKKLPLSLRSETMNNYIKKYGKATVTRPAMRSSR